MLSSSLCPLVAIGCFSLFPLHNIYLCVFLSYEGFMRLGMDGISALVRLLIRCWAGLVSSPWVGVFLCSSRARWGSSCLPWRLHDLLSLTSLFSFDFLIALWVVRGGGCMLEFSSFAEVFEISWGQIWFDVRDAFVRNSIPEEVGFQLETWLSDVVQINLPECGVVFQSNQILPAFVGE